MNIYCKRFKCWHMLLWCWISICNSSNDWFAVPPAHAHYLLSCPELGPENFSTWNAQLCNASRNILVIECEPFSHYACTATGDILDATCKSTTMVLMNTYKQEVIIKVMMCGHLILTLYQGCLVWVVWHHLRGMFGICKGCNHFCIHREKESDFCNI